MKKKKKCISQNKAIHTVFTLDSTFVIDIY